MLHGEIMTMDKRIVNAIKISVAALGANAIAFALHLQFPTSAGINAILSIQPTKRETVEIALSKVYAYMLGLLFAVILFSNMKIDIYSYGVYVVIVTFLYMYLKWGNHVTMVCVMALHFLGAGEVSNQLIVNEILLFAIGVSAGILVNLHLHKDSDYIMELKNSADLKIVRYLVHIRNSIIGKEVADAELLFNQLNDDITRARMVAEENFNNQLQSNDTKDIEYIRMRRKQAFILYEMNKVARSIESHTCSTASIEKFIGQIALNYSEDNTVEALLKEFHELNHVIKTIPLPTTREEFEDRAKLFAILRLIQEFLEEKMKYAKR